MKYLRSPSVVARNHLRTLRGELSDDRLLWGPNLVDGDFGKDVSYNFEILVDGEADEIRGKLMDLCYVSKARVKEDGSGVIITVDIDYLKIKRKADERIKAMEENEVREACKDKGLNPNIGQLFLSYIGEEFSKHAKRSIDSVMRRLYPKE